MAHAKLSPSASKIWLSCPGMPALAAGIPSTTSSYAEEGTLAHSLGEYCLRSDADPLDFVNVQFPQKNDGGTAPIISEDMARAVKVYTDFCRAETADGDDVEIEAKLVVDDDVYGTGDFVRYRPAEQHLLVADYKHGSGVPVELAGNTQLLIYAVGAARKLGNRGLKTIKLAIIQPRCPKVPPVQEWEFGVDELMEFWEKLDAGIAATKPDDAPTIAGDHCRWCPAAAICPTLRAQTVANIAMDFEKVSGMIDHDLLSKAMADVPILKARAKAIEELVEQELKAGRKVPGFKLVAGRGQRKWKDEKDATRHLLGLDFKEAYITEPATLKSPAQIETLLGKKTFKEEMADRVDTVAGSPTVAPESDKRPALHANIKADFQPIEGVTEADQKALSEIPDFLDRRKKPKEKAPAPADVDPFS